MEYTEGRLDRAEKHYENCFNSLLLSYSLFTKKIEKKLYFTKYF